MHHEPEFLSTEPQPPTAPPTETVQPQSIAREWSHSLSLCVITAINNMKQLEHLADIANHDSSQHSDACTAPGCHLRLLRSHGAAGPDGGGRGGHPPGGPTWCRSSLRTTDTDAIDSLERGEESVSSWE